MTWWLWILFWIAFWLLALAYLARRLWLLWPHARTFGRTVQTAWERAEQARATADEVRTPPHGTPERRSTEVTTRVAVDGLAWNRPASSWRVEWRATRRRQREDRLDSHRSTWVRWRRDVD